MSKYLPLIVIAVALVGISAFIYFDASQMDITASPASSHQRTEFQNETVNTRSSTEPVSQPASWQESFKSRLRQAKWTPEATDVVFDLNEIWLGILQENHPKALEQQTLRLEQFGNRYSHLMTLMAQHPEIATLLSQAYEPDKLAAVFRNESCYDVFTGLFAQHTEPSDAAELAHALEEHGFLICSLIQLGLPGVQTLFIYPESDGGKVYGKWVHEIMDTAQQGSDDDLTSLFNLLLQQGEEIRRRMISEESFRHAFPNTLWPRLTRVSQSAGLPFEFYLDEPKLWQLAAHLEGERLLQQWVWVLERTNLNPAEILYGADAYPQALHSMLIQAILTENEGIFFPLIIYGHEPNFVNLMQRNLPDSKQYALFKRLEEKGDDYFDELSHLASLETSGLMNELGDEPLAIFPGQDAWNTTKKLLQGRRVSALEIGGAAWDAIDVGMAIFTLGTSVAVTTSLKQGAKTVGKAALKQGTQTFASQTKELVLKKLVNYVPQKIAASMSDNVLLSWAKKGLLSKMQAVLGKKAANLAGKEVAEKTAFEMTNVARWVFSNAGVNLKSMKTMTGLDARVFMRKDAKVLLKIDNKKIGTKVYGFFLDTAQNAGGELVGEGLESEVAQTTIETGAKIALRASDELQAAKQNISAWWSLQASGLADTIQ